MLLSSLDEPNDVGEGTDGILRKGDGEGVIGQSSKVKDSTVHTLYLLIMM